MDTLVPSTTRGPVGEAPGESSHTGPKATLQTIPQSEPEKRKSKKRRKRKKKVNISNSANEKGIYRATEGAEGQSTQNKRPEFQMRRILSENTAYINIHGPFSGDNLSHYFMTKDEMEPRQTEKAELVDSFCPPTTLALLESNSKIPSENVCLIDDRTNDGQNSIPLGHYGPLTVRELYLKLQKPRFACSREGSVEELDISSPLSEEPASTPNADRRLIFITDPDSFSITTLMATASTSQATAVADTIYRYMAFQPHIGVCVEPRGFPFFSLSFHLPFYAWRSAASDEVPFDSRLDRNRNPLRKVVDVSFLREQLQGQTSVSTPDYLCEAQVSVLIAAIDDFHWTGLCLVDTYFSDKDSRESVDNYHDENSQEDTIETDPFSEGNLEAGFPLLNPQEYFVAVLDCRARVFSQEWERLTNQLHQRIERYINECPFMSNQSTCPTNAQLKESLRWIGRTRQILRRLTKSLRATIGRWDDFEQKKQFQTETGLKYVSSIEERFRGAGHWANDLESLCKSCEDCAKDLALWMSAEGNLDSKIQAQLAESYQTITYVLLYFVSPTTLAAAILSMQEKAIPGVLGPNKLSFVILAVVLTVLVFTVVHLMKWWKLIFPHLAGLLEKEKVKYFWSSLVNREEPLEDVELGVELNSLTAKDEVKS